MLTSSHTWAGSSKDPNDELFGDIVESTDLDEMDRYQCVFVGEPYDQGNVTGRPGARGRPRALRNALEGTKTHHFDNGPVESIGDLGDIAYPMGLSISDAQSAFLDVTKRVHARDSLPIFLGGDHSLAYPNARPLLDLYESVGVINIDAHTDVRVFYDDQPHTGTPLRQLIEEGLDAYAQIGARQFGLSTPYIDYVDEHDIEVITAEDVYLDLDESVQRTLTAMDGVDAIYVSFDVDVLDAATAPGTSSSEPGGLRSIEVYRILRQLAGDDRIEGLGVYEVAPTLDSNGVAINTSARGVAQFISGYQTR